MPSIAETAIGERPKMRFSFQFLPGQAHRGTVKLDPVDLHRLQPGEFVFKRSPRHHAFPNRQFHVTLLHCS
jgi:hypothetical protein